MPLQQVRGSTYSYLAPAGWHVATVKGTTSASKGPQLLEVATFPLVKQYNDALFGKVARELGVRMQQVAATLHGKVTHAHTVTVAGIQSHSYAVTAGSSLLEYTFVLRGRREYQLLCRYPAGTSNSACVQLLRSFTPAQ
ncbi:MAG TPA: hypothetical protein VFW85_08575 [Gaiellaceae bacterium]|nr:hypothetical protein [Gaiellaceae bacterium]